MDTAHPSACPHCFGDLSATPCPHCGWQPNVDNPPPALALGTLLDGRYRIGRVLGHGGFGITYLARDENLHLRLAIKEYLPRDCATRAPDGVSLAIYSGQAGEQFAYGLDRFLEEARALARFDQHPGIVTVKSFFRAHGTGYCVMDYVDGMTLKQYLERQPGGRIPVEQAWRLLAPVMDALRAVHKEGLLHRDLAPDNIYITRNGRVKLIDFGAARFAAGEHSRSLSIILKPGYAPEEQYRTRGKQGPWTDVYGLAATLYRAITGSTPPEALDRLEQDELALPSHLGIDIASDQERILLKALAVKAGDRYPTVADWQDEWAHLTTKQASAIPESPPLTPLTNEAVHASVGRIKARLSFIVAVVSFLGIFAIIGTIRWKEQTDESFLLPDADSEQSRVVSEPAETSAQSEPKSSNSETDLSPAINADSSEVAEQLPDELEPTIETVSALPLSGAPDKDGERDPQREQNATEGPKVLTAVESLPDEAEIIKSEGPQGLSTAQSVNVPIYYASDAPPESNIPPESPLCYRFMVSGLEEQLQKLKAKYPGLYNEAITLDPDGNQTLVAKRLDDSSNEITYFYSTKPEACEEYQKQRSIVKTTYSTSRLLEVTARALEDQLRCINQPDPGKSIRAMMANDFLRETNFKKVDGIPVLKPIVDLHVFGHKVLYVEGWQYDPDGVVRSPFNRIAMAPPHFISVVLDAKIEDVQYVPRFVRDANGIAVSPYSRIEYEQPWYLERNYVIISCYGSHFFEKGVPSG
jgi:serine/threonine protein kinase